MARTKKQTPASPKTKERSNGKDKSFHLEFKNAGQKMAWTTFQQHDVMFLLGPAGVGKSFLATAFAINEVLAKRKDRIIITRPIVEAGESLGYLPGPQPLDAKILTPHGWTTMGEIRPGDDVIGRDGKPTNVLKIFPKGEKPVYKVTTTEGTSTECCEDHLWFVRSAEDRKRGRPGSIRTTGQILENLTTKHGKPNYFLPRNEAVQFSRRERSLPVPAYTLGALIGDGSLGNSVCICNTDAELIRRVTEEVAVMECELSRKGESIVYTIKSKTIRNKKIARSVRLTEIETDKIREYPSIGVAIKETGMTRGMLSERCRRAAKIDGVRHEFVESESRWTNPMKETLGKLGIQGKKAYEKFIPGEYKVASVEDRLSLLQGLMDTDGTIKANGEASFCTTSRQLAEDVIDLVRSLGGRAVLRSRNRVGENSKLGDGRRIETRRQCFEFNVTLPEGMNPFFISRKANRVSSRSIRSIGIKSVVPVGHKEVQCILVENPEHLYLTDQYIVTHNTFEEKIYPYMLPIYDCIYKLVGKEGMQRDMINGALEVAPLAYMRGRTLSDAVCILDEAQNCTYGQLKLFVTRLGENSKMIITGDPYQSDLPARDQALNEFVDRIVDVPGVGMVSFKNDSIVRHPLLSKILERI